MRLRDAVPIDIAAITAVQRAYDQAWFGAPEHDEDEVRDEFDLAGTRVVVEAGDRLVGYGLRHRTGSSVVVDPAADVDAALRVLVPWLVGCGAPETDVLDRDQAFRTALETAGWRHVRSAFELARAVTPDWTLPEPSWPPGVDLRAYRPDDAPRIHELIYVDAGWADVPGHHARDFEEWRRIFLDGRPETEDPVMAWRADRPVGVAIGRMFSDGTGWVGQLAVARDESGRGIARALLLESYRRRVASGASSLGLGVLATNPGALQLYLRIGLRVGREWQAYAPTA